MTNTKTVRQYCYSVTVDRGYGPLRSRTIEAYRITATDGTAAVAALLDAVGEGGGAPAIVCRKFSGCTSLPAVAS